MYSGEAGHLCPAFSGSIACGGWSFRTTKDVGVGPGLADARRGPRSSISAVGDFVNLEIDTMARYVARLREFD